MATTITAGNATNGAAIASDNTGILELKTGTGSGTVALTLNASQNATLAGTLSVGAVTSTGLVTGATGALYPIVSGTAITLTNQTAPDFTSIPSWVKRITLMMNAVSANSTGIPLVQLGDSGGYETTGYSAIAALVSTTSNTTRGTGSTSGFPLIYTGGATEAYSGSFIFSLLGSNTWVCTGSLYVSVGGTGLSSVSGVKTLSDTLTSIRLYIDGTQFFDAGTINILYE